MKYSKINSIFLIFFFISGVLFSQVPQTISYQGVLTDAAGTNVADGDYSIVFTLYDALTGGTNLWTETQTVTVSGGLFNVILGSVNPVNLEFDKQYWLGISIEGGDELSPRTELTSSAYSLNTKNIPDNIVTAEKVADGNLVRSVNSLKDNVTLAAGSNVNISESGNTITISASGGGSEGISSLDGVSNDGGNIDLVAGSNVTITPDDANNKITISASGGGSGGSITSVNAGDGLTGGGSSGDVSLNVAAGDGISVSADAVSLNTTYTDARYVNEGQANSVTGSMIQNNTISAAKVSPNIVSSLDGVSNDGGNIDLVAGSNVTITPDDANNKITIAATGGSSGDNLGNHTATQNIKLNGHWLSGDGGNEGVYVKSDGKVGIGSNNPLVVFDVNGTTRATTIRAGNPVSSYGRGDIAAVNNIIADDNITAGNDITAKGIIKTGTPSSSYTTGDIVADHDLKADLSVYSGSFIRAGTSLEAGTYVNSDGNIVSSNGAILTGIPSTPYGNGDIVATDDLKCDDDIEAGGDIISNGVIKAGTPPFSTVAGDISAEHRIYVGDAAIVSGHTSINGGNSYHLSTYALYVYGSAYTTGSWNSSDIKFKKNIKDIGNTTEKLKKLRGVSFDWKVDEYKERGFSDKKQFGFIAQEVEKVFPNLVKTDENGEKAVNYIEVIPLLLEAYKYQQKEIEELRSLINH